MAHLVIVCYCISVCFSVADFGFTVRSWHAWSLSVTVCLAGSVLLKMFMYSVIINITHLLSVNCNLCTLLPLFICNILTICSGLNCFYL